MRDRRIRYSGKIKKLGDRLVEEATPGDRLAEIFVAQWEDWMGPESPVFLYTLSDHAVCKETCASHEHPVPWPCDDFRRKMGTRWDFLKSSVFVRGEVFWNWYLVKVEEERILDALAGLNSTTTSKKLL